MSKEINPDKGKTVSRSAYQRLAEENKKLKADLKIICFDDLSADTIIVRRKWHQYFEKEITFNSMMKEFATEYLELHPEYDITKIKNP